MTEVMYALTFGDYKKAGINSHSKEGVTQKNAHKQRALSKQKKRYKTYLIKVQIQH